MTDEPVPTIKDVAELLKVSEHTEGGMAKEGRLPGAVKVGRSWLASAAVHLLDA